MVVAVEAVSVGAADTVWTAVLVGAASASVLRKSGGRKINLPELLINKYGGQWRFVTMRFDKVLMLLTCCLSSSERFRRKVMFEGTGSSRSSTAHRVFHIQNLKIAVSSMETSFCGSRKNDKSGVPGHQVAVRLARSFV